MQIKIQVLIQVHAEIFVPVRDFYMFIPPGKLEISPIFTGSSIMHYFCLREIDLETPFLTPFIYNIDQTLQIVFWVRNKYKVICISKNVTEYVIAVIFAISKFVQ